MTPSFFSLPVLSICVCVDYKQLKTFISLMCVHIGRSCGCRRHVGPKNSSCPFLISVGQRESAPCPRPQSAMHVMSFDQEQGNVSSSSDRGQAVNRQVTSATSHQCSMSICVGLGARCAAAIRQPIDRGAWRWPCLPWCYAGNPACPAEGPCCSLLPHHSTTPHRQGGLGQGSAGAIVVGGGWHFDEREHRQHACLHIALCSWHVVRSPSRQTYSMLAICHGSSCNQSSRRQPLRSMCFRISDTRH